MSISLVNEVAPIALAWAVVSLATVVWNYVMSLLASPERSDVAPPPLSPEPTLHRILTWVCTIFLAGLILEGTFTMIFVLAKYGVQR